MEHLSEIFQQLDLLRQTPSVINFVQDNLLRLVLVGLAFGFTVLLVEIRLPLKYYWDLPVYALKRLLKSLRFRKTPVWGYCQDAETQAIIPVTAVELLSADTKEVIQVAYSNHLGQYGFQVAPGNYILRAVKNYYRMPPFYDPENIKLIRIDESYAVPVEKIEGETPKVNLPLQKIHTFNLRDPHYQIGFLFRTFSLNLANGLLALSVVGALYGWAITREPLYGILVAVGLLLFFVKIYILEAVGQAAS